MANVKYDGYLEAALKGEVAWLSDDFRVALVDAAQYTVNKSTHEFLSDIPAGAVVATSSALTGKTATDGVANAAMTLIPSVTGATVEALVVYKHTGSAATSLLVCYIDTSDGLPITPVGSDVRLFWPATGIFSL